MEIEQKPEVRTTSADIKKQIEQAKEEMKNSSLPITGQLANEINASESTPKAATKADDKPELQNGAAKGLETPTGEDPGLKDWAKKKGIDWTTDESVLKALHLSDQQFHEKRQKDRSHEQKPAGQAPQPTYVPPQYQPPTNLPPPVQSRQLLENLGRQYNMPPEDVERLMNFNRDFFQAASQADRQRYDDELKAIKRAEQKNSAFRELSSDSALKNPDVATEFNRLLLESQGRDPESFEQDPNAYMRVRDAALINIARRNLEGQQLQEGVSPVPRLPTNPPRNLGKGSGGGATENENGIDAQAFAKLSLADKAKVLEKAGLRPAY